jgi:glutamyl-tRNA synthetase
LLNPDKSKLSKRQGDVAVEEYRTKGFFPGALVNFVALLGWNPGDEREIFSLEELVREFTLERVGKSGAVFNLEKLNWMNTQHLRHTPDPELLTLLRPYLDAAGLGSVPDAYVLDVLRLMRDRVDKVEEFVSFSGYFFRDPESYDEVARKKNWRDETPAQIRDVLERLQALAPFGAGDVEAAVRESAAAFGVGGGKLIHPLRLAVTGVALGPGLFELMAVLGKETCIRRIERALGVLG